MVQIFNLGRISPSNWSLYLLGDLDVDMELPITNGVAAAGPGIVSVRVATDIGDVDFVVEVYEDSLPEATIEAGDDVVELAWRPGADPLTLHTTFWAIEAEPVPLPPSADGSYIVQVHTHNRDAVDGMLEVPEDFDDRERITVRISPGQGLEERVLALGSKFGRGMWAAGELPEFARTAPKEPEMLAFGEAVVLPVSYNAFVLRDVSFVVPDEFIDCLALSAAKLNGLVSNVAGHARVVTGTEQGRVSLTVRLAEGTPPIRSVADLNAFSITLDQKDDAVLVAHDTEGELIVEDVEGQALFRLPALTSGRYGLVVVAKDRDAADRASRRRSKKEQTVLEEILVVLWPDATHEVVDELVLQRASKFAQHIVESAERIRDQVSRHRRFEPMSRWIAPPVPRGPALP